MGRMGGGLHFLVEIELKMAKIPPFTNVKGTNLAERKSSPDFGAALLTICYSLLVTCTTS